MSDTKMDGMSGIYRGHAYQIRRQYATKDLGGGDSITELVSVDVYVDHSGIALSTPGYEPNPDRGDTEEAVKKYIDFLESQKGN